MRGRRVRRPCRGLRLVLEAMGAEDLVTSRRDQTSRPPPRRRMVSAAPSGVQAAAAGLGSVRSNRCRSLHPLAKPEEFSGVIEPFDFLGLGRRVMLHGVEAHLMPVRVVQEGQDPA
jgi:hypothetical protein